MQVVVWIVIILVAVFLIWLLRKWLKRIIFVVILLVLAFFIYGLFSPSGASRLWYNVRTFPQRVTSWISDKVTFMDYDTYKLDMSSVGVKLDGADDVNSVRDSGDSVNVEEDNQVINSANEGDALKPSSVEVKTSNNTLDNHNKSKDSKEDFEGYSKDDLIGIITKYVENNLDDDTDIIVTVEYEKDEFDPDKIILQTQSKSQSDVHFVSLPRLSVKKVFNGLQRTKTQTVTIVSGNEDNAIINTDNSDAVVIQGKRADDTAVSVDKKTSNGLTQSEVREAEEIFGILF